MYPLTVAQKFHLYYAPHCPNMAVLNIGTSLTIEVELDWDQLKKSINEAYARSEGMRVRFAKDKEGTWYQYVMDPEEKDIEFVDFSDRTVEEAEAEMQKWTTVPFKMFDAPLTRIVMIKMPDGFNGVYFLGNHMIVDAQSLICFLKDIIELYCNAKYEGVPYPKEMTSYLEQLQKDLAYEAGKLAIERANLKPSDIDAVIVATLSPDYLTMPSTACIAAYKLGIQNKPAFDISGACSGFVYLLNIAKSFIESRTYSNILIIGAEKVSSVLDFEDRGTCVLFGDGGGAAIVSATTEKSRSILDVHVAANGQYGDLLYTPRFNATSDSPKQCLQMKGNEVFKQAVKTLAQDVKDILENNAIKPQDVRFFVPHQANLRIINAVGEILDFSPDQIVLTVQKYGNTSAASIPMAIDEIYRQGQLKNGDLLLLDAFGGGFTWGSALVYFDGDSL